MLDSLFRITDRFGNDYAATAISIPPTPNWGVGGDSLLPDSAKMTAGMFTLYFEDVMNQNPNLNSFRNAAARNLAVRVYSDLSAMLDYAGEAGRVRIYIRQSETEEGAAAMSGSSFYLLPKSQRQALVYGDVWKAIVTGSGHSILGEKYHGFMKLNSAYLYQFEPDAPFATGNEYDLYTIFLHQALQILGLNTAMDMNDAFYTYASRYDLHLQDANHTNLVTLNAGLPTWNTAIPVTDGCNTLYFEGTNTPQQLIYSPTTWEEGNSLSEVNCTASGCDADAFVMKHCIGAGNTFALRHPHLREVQMLADIGYKLTGVYGFGGTSSEWDYDTEFAVGGCNPIGFDDYRSSPSGQVVIVDVLGNDNIGGSPVGVQLVGLVYPTIYGTASLNSNNDIVFTPTPNLYGAALITYQPLCNGVLGNLTFVRIWVTPPRCSVSTNCGENLIDCGSFECTVFPQNYYLNNDNFLLATTGAGPFINNTFVADPATGFFITTPSAASINSPDLLINSTGAPASINCSGGAGNFAANTGNRCVGLLATTNPNEREAFALQTCKPIPNNASGTITFWAKLADANCAINQISLNAAFGEDAPIPMTNAFTNPGLSVGPSQVILSGSYVQYTLNFTNTSGADWNWLILYTNVGNPASPNSVVPTNFGYVVIDDIAMYMNFAPLQITKTLLNGPTFQPGTAVQYQISVTNPIGNPTNANIVATDVFAPELLANTVANITYTCASCSVVVGTNNDIQFNIPNLSGGQTASVSFEIEVDAALNPVCPIVVQNCATLSVSSDNCELPATACATDITITNVPGAAYFFPGGSTYYLSTLGLPLGGPYTVSFGDFSTIIADLPFAFNGSAGSPPSSQIDFAMGAGTVISVPTGNWFAAFNCHFHSCDAQWKGIWGDPDSKIIVEESLIEDAEYAVYATDDCALRIVNNTFDKNFVGIKIESANSPTLCNVSTAIQNNAFVCSSPLIAPYIGQTYPVGIRSFAGIWATNLTVLNLWYPNLFKNQHIGILGNRANLNIRRATFIDIQKDPVYPTGFGQGGSGIFARGDAAGGFWLRQTGFGNTPSSPISFQNCQYGIYVHRINSRIAYNRMQNINIDGIRVLNINNSSAAIHLNRIQTRFRGVYMLFNFQNGGIGGTLHVNNNFIEVNAPYSNNGAAGIMSQEIANFPNNLRVLNDTVIIDGGNHGILLRGNIYSTVAENIVKLSHPTTGTSYTPTFVPYGIAVEGGNANLIQNNLIAGSHFLDTDLPQQTGVLVSQSPKNRIGCNTTDNSYIGFQFEGACNTTDLFKENGINEHFYGLYVNGVTGTQDNTANTWNPAVSYAGDAAAHWGGVPAVNNSIFRVSPYISPYIPPSITVTAGVPWFFNVTPTPLSVTCSISGGEGIGLNELDYMIADSSLNYPIYTNEIEWTAEKQLYEKLQGLQDSIALDSTMQTFYNSKETEAMGKLQGVEDKHKEIIAANANTNIANVNASLFSIIESVAEIDSLLDITPTDSILTAERTALLSQIVTLSYINHDFTANYSRIDSLKEANDSISTEYYYEENAKKVNEIYLSTLAKDITDFTQDQIEGLYNIANQCPLAGGEAVYRARAMYSLINPEAYYLDKELCIQSGNNWRKGDANTISDSFDLYPNPSQGSVNCHYKVKKGNECVLYFYNTFGQVLQKSGFSTTSNIHTIDISKLTSGVYYYKLVEGNKEKHTGKIVIIK